MRISGTFHVEHWEETTVDTLDEGSKITRASVRQSFAGGLKGEGSVTYVMAYRPDQTAAFVGVQRLAGEVEGRAGVLVVQVTGAFENGLARGQWAVVEGMGTGPFADRAGAGSFEAPHGPDGTYELTLEVADER